MFGNNNEIKVCGCKEEEPQTPLLWTFKFSGAEYWCPSCGYTSGMFGAGTSVPITKELKKEKKKWEKKTKPYLSGETEDWVYEPVNYKK
jgi:hypothetical protein